MARTLRELLLHLHLSLLNKYFNKIYWNNKVTCVLNVRLFNNWNIDNLHLVSHFHGVRGIVELQNAVSMFKSLKQNIDFIPFSSIL